MSDGFPFVRITVLGSAGSGKTSLIYSFVNNTCPKRYTRTVFPTLYYRVVRLPPEADPKGSITSVCVEIEDTVAPEVVEEEEETEAMAAGVNLQGEGNVEGRRIDAAPAKALKLKNVQFFFDMSRRNIVVPDGVTDFTPFSIWKCPKTPIRMEQPVYIPLTQGRMAFIIVFDSNDQESFDRACQLYIALISDLDRQKVRIRPYICFVANKIEKDPESSSHKSIILLAEQFTQQHFVRLMKVSALQGKNVKRTFWDLLYLIIGNQVLWEIEYEVPGEEDSNDEEVTGKDGAGGCVQS